MLYGAGVEAKDFAASGSLSTIHTSGSQELSTWMREMQAVREHALSLEKFYNVNGLAFDVKAEDGSTAEKRKANDPGRKKSQIEEMMAQHLVSEAQKWPKTLRDATVRAEYVLQAAPLTRFYGVTNSKKKRFWRTVPGGSTGIAKVHRGMVHSTTVYRPETLTRRSTARGWIGGRDCPLESSVCRKTEQRISRILQDAAMLSKKYLRVVGKDLRRYVNACESSCGQEECSKVSYRYVDGFEVTCWDARYERNYTRVTTYQCAEACNYGHRVVHCKDVEVNTQEPKDCLWWASEYNVGNSDTDLSEADLRKLSCSQSLCGRLVID